MMFGLKEGQAKMSKSDPDSAIFMEDSAKEVDRKIKSSYCPPGVIHENPVLDYVKHIVFGCRDAVHIKRKPEFGGDVYKLISI
jgi:tyrosyl-tRNA synthetase